MSALDRCTAALRELITDPSRLTHFRTTLRLAVVGDPEPSRDTDAPLPLVAVQCVETASGRVPCVGG